MITLSNIRMEQQGDWTRLICDFGWEADMSNPFFIDTLWFAVKNENADFFTTEVYDPFVLVTYYAAMQYGENLKICGKISKKLYKNITKYIYRILLDFSEELKPIDFSVDGYGNPKGKGNMIGAGISCGVDSLSTIYGAFAEEDDPEYRINSLFLFNHGTHGDFEDERTHKLFEARLERNANAARDLGLPIYEMDSNLHTITHVIGGLKVGLLALCSCVLALQSKISKYYISASVSYSEIAGGQKNTHDHDLDMFCGSYLVPLIGSENVELIYDGAQYKRTEKTELISDWGIAQKHLNVCIARKDTPENCSCCAKCFRTLIALEAIGKLDEFSEVFDLFVYKKRRFHNLCKMISKYHKDDFAKDNVNFARSHGIKMTPVIVAKFYCTAYKFIKTIGKYVLSDNQRAKLKSKLMTK